MIISIIIVAICIATILFIKRRVKPSYRPVIKYGYMNDDFIRNCMTATIEHGDNMYSVKLYNDGRITVFHDMRFSGGELEEKEAPEFIAKWFR